MLRSEFLKSIGAVFLAPLVGFLPKGKAKAEPDRVAEWIDTHLVYDPQGPACFRSPTREEAIFALDKAYRRSRGRTVVELDRVEYPSGIDLPSDRAAEAEFREATRRAAQAWSKYEDESWSAFADACR